MSGVTANLTDEQVALFALMSDLSEDAWAAGWMADTEYGIWALLVGDADGWGMMPADACRDELAAIAAAAERIGCWIVWDGFDTLPRGLPLDEWRARYDARRR